MADTQDVNGPHLVITLTDQDGVVLDRRSITWDRWEEALGDRSSAAVLLWGLAAGPRPQG